MKKQYALLSIFLLSQLLGFTQQEGSIDYSFNTEVGPKGSVFELMDLKNGETLVCGTYSRFGVKTQNSVAFVNDTAELISKALTPFVITKQGLNVTRITRAIEQPDNKIVLFNCMPEPRIHRYHFDGTKDTSFNPGKGMGAGGNEIQDAVLQPDGKIIIAGTFLSIDSKPNTTYLARLNADGSVDEEFRKNLVFKTGGPASLAVKKDGKIVIGGRFMKVSENGGPNQEFTMAILNEDGSINQTLDAKGDVRKIALQSDEKIVYVYQAGSNFNEDLFLRRLNLDGDLDTTFTDWKIKRGGQDVFVYDLCIQPDDKIIVGGNFVQKSTGGPDLNTTIDSAFYLFRLTEQGVDDTSFYFNANRSVYPSSSVSTIHYTRKGQILIGGAFINIGGHPAYKYARLFGDGKIAANVESNDIKPLINVYPNPAQTKLHLYSNSRISKVELWNSFGQLVQTTTDNLSIINVSALNRGVYFLRIQNGTVVTTKRVVLN